jgi:hypothetical protein
VAAWGLSEDVLRSVVGTVKRAPAYRAICRDLPSRCPRDVWVEDGIGFVQFDSGVGAESPAWFVFAVALDSLELVAAKRLVPDAKGRRILVRRLAAEPAPA